MNTTTLLFPYPRTSTGKIVGSTLIIWFGIALYASITNLPGQTPWSMPLLVAAPLAVFGFSWFAIPSFRDWALGLDQRFLILLHTWRMLGLGFVMLFYYQVLPAQFALPAGLGDAAAAVWALFLGAALYRGELVEAKTIRAWNNFGMIDFVAAVSLGLASRSVPLGLISDGVSADPMGMFPLSIVPLFGVPLFVMTHLIIYAQLRRSDQTNG